jgi:hypothetical protein
MENEKRRCRLSAGVNERVIAKSRFQPGGVWYCASVAFN